MDGFMNLAKQGLDAYQKSQTDVSKTGGQEYNSPHHSGQDGSSHSGGPEIDHHEAIKNAERNGSGEGSLFSTALGFLSDNKHKQEEPVDEDEVTRAHEKVYQQGDTSNVSANALGGAAALQVLKQFVGGSGGSKTSGGNSQTQLIGLAMAEATKLFDKSGGAASGNKQDAVNGAAMTIMKLLVQSKFSGGITGGSNSGGLSGLMGLASQLAK
ncbi:hypothetical protein BDQ12DRAFT_686152 [Crucibulum laeve]|uniref:DUF7721 domain-containing protein n=1 Tax=Crucibulum laeve TaxID=68775 RepID=A0A5C3LW59_9AGAR|nr:hypothetical protein BDQ12DRAFT_686152 [Crucibulum laeve]